MRPLTASRAMPATPQGGTTPTGKAPRRSTRANTKSDPAPSRWAYRLQRVLLTPAYRLALRVTVPFVVAMVAMGGFLSDDERRDNMVLALYDLRDVIYKRPEFQIALMAIEGASVTTQDEIREVANTDFPVSTFDLNLESLRESIEDLPAVAEASLRIRQKGVLEVVVTERSPAMLWRTRQGISVVDASGVIIGEAAHRGEYPDLPLIAGLEAGDHVTEALDLWRIAAPLGARMRGLVRVGERRWDVVLTKNLRIMLPEQNPGLALERVIALHNVQDVLSRDLSAVDMRLAARPTLRMNPEAVKRWWQIKDFVVETGDG